MNSNLEIKSKLAVIKRSSSLVRSQDWMTTYYDINDHEVGTSYSKPITGGINRSSQYTQPSNYDWITTYHNANGEQIGYSKSTPINPLKDPSSKYTKPHYYNWVTTYYNMNGQQMGISKSKPITHGAQHSDLITSPIYEWITDYFNINGQYIGTSESSPITDAEPYDDNWETVYSSPLQIAEKKKIELLKTIPKNHTEEAEPLLAAQKTFTKLEQIRIMPEEPSVSQLKQYYLSQACFFNASHLIFVNNDRNEIYQTLKNRAKRNPGGASEKTLQRYAPNTVSNFN